MKINVRNLTLLLVIVLLFNFGISAQEPILKSESVKNINENGEKVENFVREFNNFSNEIIRMIELLPNSIGVRNVLLWFETNSEPLLEKWKTVKGLSVSEEAYEEFQENHRNRIYDIDSLVVKYEEQLKKEPDMKLALTKLIKDFDELLEDDKNLEEKDKSETNELAKGKDQPIFLAYKVDEISNVSEDELNQRMEMFKDLLELTPNANRFVICYDGLGQPLKYKDNPESRFASMFPNISCTAKWEVREIASIEFFIIPNGADKPTPTLTYNLSNLTLYDDSSLPPSMIQKSALEIENSAIKKAEPKYPQIAKAAKAEGNVLVAIEINEKGDVTSAKSFYGHPLLKAAAEKAVYDWAFVPEKRNNKLVKVVGFLVINFQLSKNYE